MAVAAQNSQKEKQKPKATTMTDMKCPYCRHKLETWAKYTDGTSKVWCHECNIFGDSKLFEDLNKNKQQIKKLTEQKDVK